MMECRLVLEFVDSTNFGAAWHAVLWRKSGRGHWEIDDVVEAEEEFTSQLLGWLKCRTDGLRGRGIAWMRRQMEAARKAPVELARWTEGGEK